MQVKDAGEAALEELPKDGFQQFSPSETLRGWSPTIR